MKFEFHISKLVFSMQYLRHTYIKEIIPRLPQVQIQLNILHFTWQPNP